MSFQPGEMMGRVRAACPLVHHITNYVTVNDCANATICAGGSPVMTDEALDLPGMVPLASAVVLNMGTLNVRTVESMVQAGKIANAHGIPVLFDPVGAGATPYRTQTAERILREVKVSVIKGNAGEIGVLAGTGGEVKGVDSHGGTDTAAAVRTLAQRTGAVTAATGETDYVSDGKTAYTLRNGDALLGKISGTGCMVSSVAGCYIGACGVSAESVAAGITAFNTAAELAVKGGKVFGPASFKTKVLDTLYSMDPENADSLARFD
ncbi:hydroxyethylthiazole kinase [Candidatus Methanomethylophilus sp. 1R26]|uniref:hydroxyethylthiazole kinase n=1 Tax=Candidatus Methanomethylophilus sp. 1R26 TaxID=1769296 RepID=UPI000ADCCF13|nr:hydroxyethylthiazole kinase [Candidatus Methanomethylophilus sp. 1R26]